MFLLKLSANISHLISATKTPLFLPLLTTAETFLQMRKRNLRFPLILSAPSDKNLKRWRHPLADNLQKTLLLPHFAAVGRKSQKNQKLGDLKNYEMGDQDIRTVAHFGPGDPRPSEQF